MNRSVNHLVGDMLAATATRSPTTVPTMVSTTAQAPPTSGLLGQDQERMLEFLSDWWISIGAMASLLLQILLLLTGGTRKWNRACRLVAWSSYNMSDFTATLVLGGLAQTAANSGKTIYAVWAPMLLLHLGAPDNISAYSLEDAELWQRHGFTMLLQVVSAAYVVGNCAATWRYGLVSMCLLAAGSIKAAERTLALRCASRAALEASALPIFEYMRLEPWLAESRRAESRRAESRRAESRLTEAGGGSGPRLVHHVFDGETSRFDYILMGEDRWFREFQLLSGDDGPEDQDDGPCCEAARRSGSRFVTLHDVLSSPGLSRSPSVVLMCVGFSLFKLYRRRLSSLYMYEWRHIPKTLLFFLGPRVFASAHRLLFALDVELRFLFDSLYTKASGTAFTRLGVVFRVGTTALLVVSGIFLVSPAMELDAQAQLVKQAPSITFFLLAAALVVEAYQLARIMLSDWTKVWLAYTYVRLTDSAPRRRNRLIRRWAANAVLELIRMGDSIARHKYWNNRIGQYSMRGGISPDHNLSASASASSHLLRDLWPRYEYDPRTIDDFKRYVLLKVLDSLKACPAAPIVMTASKPYINQLFARMPPHHRICAQSAIGKAYTDIEHILVNWHVATCVCELLDYSAAPDRDDAQLLLQIDVEDVYSDADHVPHLRNRGRYYDPPASASGTDHRDTDHRDRETEVVDRGEARYHQGWTSSSGWCNYPGSSVHGARSSDMPYNVGGAMPPPPPPPPPPPHDATPIPPNANYATEEDELEQGGLPRVRLMSKLLSRYMAYLLVHKTELLPCHAYTAKRLAMSTQSALRLVAPWDRANVLRLLELAGREDKDNKPGEAGEESEDPVGEESALERELGTGEEEEEAEEDQEEEDRGNASVPHRLRSGLQAAWHLQKIKDVEERWRFIMEFWVEILIFIAAANKASEQLQQLTLGGEFLTNIWVLLGHMGAGEK